nr:immunoglobulin light chain junction region [Macaca mulatta]MPN80689.1 immunoglobulin light chain junction region [Macaca mulatta]MPN81187.1 immunoglobulin light chain junction region [Macaca mulatta]MPN81516.1 immunoglobulin light chain junction region [Macaca mulatta]
CEVWDNSLSGPVF